MDRDARVQASAVEALWALDAAESRALLLTASKSKYNRVAANAILGLYRIADLKAVRIVAGHGAPARGASLPDIGALGHRRNPRSAFPAISHGAVQIFGWESTFGGDSRHGLHTTPGKNECGGRQITTPASRRLAPSADGKRRFALVLSSQPPRDLGGLTPTGIRALGRSELIENYEVKIIRDARRRWRPALSCPIHFQLRSLRSGH